MRSSLKTIIFEFEFVTTDASLMKMPRFFLRTILLSAREAVQDRGGERGLWEQITWTSSPTRHAVLGKILTLTSLL